MRVAWIQRALRCSGAGLLALAIGLGLIACDSGGGSSGGAADVTGDWSGDCRGDSGFFVDGFTDLAADEAGNITGKQGEAEISGTLDGRELVIVRQNGTASNGSVLSTTYRATVSGDRMLVEGIRIIEDISGQIQTLTFECTFNRQ